LCLIEGPAGVGKTALLHTTCELAQASGLRTLWASAGALGRDLPWNLVRQLFTAVIAVEQHERSGALVGAAALAAPALGLEAGDDAGSLHGLYWLTVNLAQEAPLLIAVDDAHWGDAPSLRFLAHLGQRLEDLPLVLALSMRSGEERPAALAALGAAPGTDAIVLHELSPDGSADLVRRELGVGAAGEFCAACHAATGGNPFLLGELVSRLARDGIEPSAEHADEVAGVTPRTVVHSVLLRLSGLPPGARALANAVAVLGDCGLAPAAALAGLDTDGAALAADALARAWILRPGTPLGFVHPLVREVVYHELPPLLRARRHGEAARLLARAGAASDRIGAQLLESEPEGDKWTVDQLRRSAHESAAKGAPGSAVRLLERALDEPPNPAERAGLLVELGRAEAAIGRPGAIERLEEAATASAEPRDRAEILLELGRIKYVRGRPREAADAFDAGLRELNGAGAEDSSLVAQLRAGWLTAARIEAPLRARATELVHEIGEHPPAPSSYGERALLAQVAGQLTFEGEPCDRVIELARVALGNGELLREETSDGMSWVAAMGALGWGGDFDGYEALQEQALADARRRGSVIGFATASYGYSYSHYYRGMLADAVADAEQAIAAERDGWQQFLPAARAQLAWALIEQDEMAAAADALARARRDSSWERSSMQALVLEAEARIQLARSEAGLALATALDAGRVFDEAMIPNPAVVPWRSRAALAAAQLGRRDQADALVDEELMLARRFGAPRPIGMALIARGIIDGPQGAEALEEAVDTLAGSPARLEYARAMVLLGAALRRQRKSKAAREILRSGLELTTSLGALALERRAAIELDAAGARPRKRAVSGVDALTPAERRVAGLAAEGMTNPEIAQALFVSLRTVETHLTHTYQKLDIDSRAQLARALNQPRSA
jgi:DNA-binding NarL/FixJ family response regulator